jgi:hypothetical protein
MIAKRLATVVVAAGLIVGALLIRRNVIEGGDDGDSDDGPEPTEELVCLTELADVCASLGENHPDLTIRVEAAGATLARIAEGEPAPMWVTFAPFPAMADGAPYGADPEVLASSRLAVATPVERGDVLATACASAPLWQCIGDAAGEPWSALGGEAAWGPVKPSVGNAGSSAGALASFAVAVAGYYNTADLTGALWTGDAVFLGWVSGLVREVPLTSLTGTPLDTMLIRASVNVAATSDAEIAALGARAAEVAPSYPEPSMWLQAVLAAPAGAEVPDGLARDSARGLLAAGWDPPEDAAQPLPSATTMIALRQLWEEAR